MARLVVWGPGSTAQDREVTLSLVTALRSLGHAADASAGSDLPALRAELERCDALVAVLEGVVPAPEAFLMLGLAQAQRRPSLVLRSDARPLAPSLEPLVRSAARTFAPVPSWEAAALEPILKAFLGHVKVFAGTLVRDAVPQILEKEGRPLRFRAVEPTAYPQVLKRKLVETAQRLEETEFGLEQEEIADLLEVLETLINLRGYDRESLRSIKEGKWRRRGGYERGLLLEEEPKALQP